MHWKSLLLNTFLIYIFTAYYVAASNGDRSSFYQKCVKFCRNDNCTKLDSNVFTEQARDRQDFSTKLLKWSCTDECSYDCMWKTVGWFEKQSASTPKFHGKWPFYRFFGIQEPASALFSVFNLIAHIQMFKKLRKKFTEPDIPFKVCWTIFAMVCVHAWIWSTIFHTRDTPITEFMDYTCALSMVMGFYATAVIRVLYGLWHPFTALLVLIPGFIYCADHMGYLWSGQVDYSMNMALNISLGVVGGLLWLFFAMRQSFKYGEEGRYVWRIAAFTTLTGCFLGLEVFDFPPFFGVLDAHALWHLCTSPLPYLFYGFLIDDIDFIVTSKKRIKLL